MGVRTGHRRMTAWRAALAIGVAIATQAMLRGQAQPAAPLDPNTAVIDAFGTHDIVALGEGKHNNDQAYAFRLALIRDPRFAMTVNDIVVESGSSKYQDVMDHFIRGESIPDAILRRSWQDTTIADGAWDVPMYEEFFRAVRTLNGSLPKDRQLRVLLGDPPFDWDRATREESIRISLDRDPFAAALIEREVLSKRRRALVIYGDSHLSKRPPMGSNLVTRVEAAHPGKIFAVWTHSAGADLEQLQPDIRSWRVPALALTKGTTLGVAPFSFYREGFADVPRMEDQYDAVLYLGPVSSITVRRGQIAPALCADGEYMKMRLARMALVDPPGRFLPPGIVSPADRVKDYCARALRNEGRS